MLEAMECLKVSISREYICPDDGTSLISGTKIRKSSQFALEMFPSL